MEDGGCGDGGGGLALSSDVRAKPAPLCMQSSEVRKIGDNKHDVVLHRAQEVRSSCQT